MKRKVIEELIHWKSNHNRQPMLLLGGKGVGKTYLAYDFAKAFFEHICYINFERDSSTLSLFQSRDRQSAQEQIREYFHIDETATLYNTILILDEVNYCPQVFRVLKEQLFHGIFDYILTISSTPIMAEHENLFRNLHVYPLEFDEFLRATSNEWYIEAIIHHYRTNTNMPEIVHKELLYFHELYLQIGGMPGMINEYLNLNDPVNISEQHRVLMGSYSDYILRNNSDSDSLKMKQVFDSLIYQLTKENKKFQYKIIRKGTTHAMYQDPIERLVLQNYVIRCNRIGTEQLQTPSDIILMNNASDKNISNFKLYYPDTGLLYTKIVEEYGISKIPTSRKTLLENYVAQSLQAKHYPFAFWESESMAKIDFIIAKNLELLPIEVYDGEKTRSKSISVLKQKCEFPYAIKISAKNFDYSGQIKYVPYYAVFCL